MPDLCDEETLVQIATAAFVKELGLEDGKVLEGGKVEIRDVSTGTHLMKEDSHKVKLSQCIYWKLGSFLAY